VAVAPTGRRPAHAHRLPAHDDPFQSSASPQQVQSVLAA
jgi:hypothetical protein